jgi:hypothetical protein
MRCELIIDQLVEFLMEEPTHSGSSPQLGIDARIFLVIPVFNGVMLLVVGQW